MVLEATMIVVDNSESSRNGDYLPTRFDAQADAVNLIFQAKTQANPESSVGLMSMGASGPEVLTTLTADFGKILDGLHRIKIKGSSHFSTALNVAALALKHRQNKSQRQRIIVFTCSRLAEDEKSMVKLAKRMKKININIDLIAFGDLENDTTKKLEAFNEHVRQGGENVSHLEIVPPGPNLLSDAIVTTPILAGEAMGGGAGVPGTNGDAGAAGGEQFEFGVDPSIDPELALALRMSLEEEKARQERERKDQDGHESTNLEAIPEGDAIQPSAEGEGRLNATATNAMGSVSGTSGSVSQPKAEEEGADKKKDGDQDQMDTS